jgi:hypothetical protein
MPLKRLFSPLIVIIVGVIVTIFVLAAPGAGTARPRPQTNYPYPGSTSETKTTTATATVTGTPGTPGTSDALGATPSVTQETPTKEATEPPKQTKLPSPTNTATVEETLPALAEATPTLVMRQSCTPGEPVEITGEGPPHAAFLLYFGERVVSGGSVAEDGRFAIKLVIGRERPGAHIVAVRLRSGGDVLRELICDVPIPPTPTPMKGQPKR